MFLDYLSLSGKILASGSHIIGLLQDLTHLDAAHLRSWHEQDQVAVYFLLYKWWNYVLPVDEIICEVYRRFGMQVFSRDSCINEVTNGADIIYWFFHDLHIRLSRNNSMLTSKLLSQGHLVFAHLHCIIFRVFAQKLQEASRDDQLVRGHLTHVGLPLHAINKAR